MSRVSSQPHTRRPVPRSTIVLLGTAGLGALLLLRFRDPHAGGSYGFCPFHELTGLWCPLCGGLRATHDLTTLHVGDALSSNVLAVLIVLLGGGYYLYWAARRWTGRPVRTFVLGARGGLLVMAVAMAFTVARNLPVGGVLAP